MGKGRKRPEIRFKGFAEDWEESNISEIVSVYSGRDYKHLEEGEIPVYGTGGYMLSVNEALSYDEDAIGIGRKGTIDKPYLLRAPFWTVDTLFYAVPMNSENLDFVYDIFQGIDWRKKDESTGVPSLSKESINRTEVMVPKSDEQKKIGSFFSNLDNIISLHQQKYDKLVYVKKSMLEKMFPQNGEKKPEIRFKGFTEDWVQQKFGEVNDLITGYPFESSKFSENGIKLVRGMNVKRGYLDFSDEICMKSNTSDGLENYLLQENDILIQMDGALIGKSYAKIKRNQLPALLVQRVTRARVNEEIADSNFMYQTIQRDFLTYIEMNKTETAVPHMSLNDIRDFSIMIPCKEEQQKIGVYFSNLDHLINFHHRKLTHLKNIKKAMLEKMFV